MQIAYLQGAGCGAVQDLLWDFAQGLRGQGHRVVGMVEQPDQPEGWQGKDSHLTDLEQSCAISLYQDLGAMAQSCTLDGTALSEASGVVEARLEAGTELLIISKFGKVEAETGGGFCSAFCKALLLGVPVLTSVNPKFEAAWQAFSGGLALRLEPTPEALALWWAGQHSTAAAALGTRARSG